MTGRPDDGSDPLSELADSPAGALARRLVAIDTTRIVLAIMAVALLIRFVGLGTRPMHYDESRVAYWILHYVDTGSFTYRHGIHGPFIQHVNHWLFPLLGPSDFTARLPVAVVGGLLPAVALLFREHLKRSELIALALFLSFNSLLVYYSRFMRSDILLAGFMFLAFGLLVRFYDTRDVRYLYGLAVFAAFGFATKENALVYALTWVGATGLLADQALFRPRKSRTGIDVLQAKYASLRGRWRDVLPHYVGHVVGAIVVFLLVLVFMYADRGAGIAGIRAPPASPEEGAVGFWEALASPVGFPGYAYDTLAASFDEALQWGGRGAGGDSDFFSTYAENIGTDLNVLATNAPVLLVFAVLGFVWERYGRANARNLVMFAGYWGFVSVLGYPLADDIGSAHWLHVHILVPLSIPAAVAVARLYRWGRAASVERDTAATAAVALVLLLAGVQVGATTVSDGYLDTTSQENQLVQFAQPEAEMRAATVAIDRVAGTTNSADIVVYTDAVYEGARPLVDGPDEPEHSFALRPACQKGAWYNSLPLPWYLNTAGADVACETNPGDLARTASQDAPPLIVTLEDDRSVPVGELRESYTPRTFDMFQFSHRVTVYLHEDRVDEVPGWETAGDDPSR
jgi:uncharacterized protein (TIGR03663 family)